MDPARYVYWRGRLGLSDPASFGPLPEMRLAIYGSEYATGQENPMKAIVYDKYRSPDVLEMYGIDKPEVKGDEVLV